MLHKAKIAKGGKISIPSVYRKYLNIKEGQEIIFNLKQDELTLTPIKTSLEKIRKMVDKYHGADISLVDRLITERRIEAKNE